MLTQKEIKSVFDQMDLGTPEKRKHFRELESKKEQEVSDTIFIRLSSKTSQPKEKENSAELESNS